MSLPVVRPPQVNENKRRLARAGSVVVGWLSRIVVAQDEKQWKVN